MQGYDASSKWLIQQHGDSLLRLAGIRGIESWTALQAEPVEPRRLPDGILEVRRRGHPLPALVVLEVSTYAYSRLARQAADDAMLMYLKRGIVPEVVALVLKPRGKKPAPSKLIARSGEGTTTVHVAWKVIEMWKVPAAELLAAGDVGLIPLVPLAGFDGPLEPILVECRERIERVAPPEERENLRVATHFLAGLKYNDPRLFQKLGGRKNMLKTGSPLLREILEEETRKARRQGRLEGEQKGRLEGKREGMRETAESGIIKTLAARFGADAETVRGKLGGIADDPLEELIVFAATCPDLDSFREKIAPRKRKGRS